MTFEVIGDYRFLESRKHSIRETFYRQLPLTQRLKQNIYFILWNKLYLHNVSIQRKRYKNIIIKSITNYCSKKNLAKIPGSQSFFGAYFLLKYFFGSYYFFYIDIICNVLIDNVLHTYIHIMDIKKIFESHVIVRVL